MTLNSKKKKKKHHRDEASLYILREFIKLVITFKNVKNASNVIR